MHTNEIPSIKYLPLAVPPFLPSISTNVQARTPSSLESLPPHTVTVYGVGAVMGEREKPHLQTLQPPDDCS